MEERTKTDYPEFEGKNITIKHLKSKKRCTVIGCNFDIGITLVETINKNNYILCLRGPSSAHAKNFTTEYPMEEYKNLFYFYLKGIKKGFINCSEGIEKNYIKEGVYGNTGNNASSETCAFF